MNMLTINSRDLVPLIPSTYKHIGILFKNTLIRMHVILDKF